MRSDEYQRASDLFNELLDVPESELDARLDAACGADAGLRAEVLRMLKADRAAGGFLERGAMKDGSLMLLASGALRVPETIAHYKVLSKLGEGGMGEVWRARDSKLGRDVAIKFLPETFAADPDRFGRFNQEAQVLASLNHANIATVYGVEDRALVMELVEGPTLAERIAQEGHLPWDEAREIAVQIAEALEAAHEKGVVHRDLKPANIKVTPEGRVKVLDFGLAKPQAKEHSSGTSPGVILGTPAYMAPEQAKGKAVDRRADLWAFGVVMYEMLTGRNPFQRETVAETLAAVLKEDADLKPLPEGARPIVERCLRKDPRRRWQSAGDARIAIEEADTSRDRQKRFGRGGWAAIGAVCATAALVAVSLMVRPEAPLPAPVQFTVSAPGNDTFATGAALRVSPDGQNIAFIAVDPADTVRRAYVYNLADGWTKALPGTEQVMDANWSFDGNTLVLRRANGLSRIDIRTGAGQALPFDSAYSSWGRSGGVGTTRDGLAWMSMDPASSHLLMKAPAGLVFVFPSLIPGGRWMVFNAYDGTPAHGVSVQIAQVDGRKQTKLFAAERSALYAGPGYILFLKNRTLTAQPIDPVSGKLRGEPLPVTGSLAYAVGDFNPGDFSASNNGVLAFRTSPANLEYRLIWFDRSGKQLGTAGRVAAYTNPALSPDGNRLAVGIRDPITEKRELWILDLQRGTDSRLTFNSADNLDPVWSADGARIAFTSDRKGARDIYVKNASGTGEEELVLQSAIPKNVEDWSRDGRWIVYNEAVPQNGDDLAVVSLETRKAQDFLRTRFHEDKGRFSPDGKWLAYQSDESGQAEVYVQPFPPTGGKWQISTGGGGAPQWRADGKELFYSTLQDPSRMMAVDIGVKNGAIKAGIPRLLFETRLQPAGARNRWVVSGDGKRFLAVVPAVPKPVRSFTVIVNWPSLLGKSTTLGR